MTHNFSSARFQKNSKVTEDISVADLNSLLEENILTDWPSNIQPTNLWVVFSHFCKARFSLPNYIREDQKSIKSLLSVISPSQALYACPLHWFTSFVCFQIERFCTLLVNPDFSPQVSFFRLRDYLL